MYAWKLTLEQVLDMTLNQFEWHEDQAARIQKAITPKEDKSIRRR